MKKLEVKSTKTVIETVFETVDGIRFKTEDECTTYEDALKKTLIGELKLKDNIIFTADIGALIGVDECIYKSIIPTSKEDIRNLNIMHNLYGGKIATENKFTEKDLGKLILIGLRLSDGSDWVWFVNLSDVVDAVSGGTCFIEQSKVKEMSEIN